MKLKLFLITQLFLCTFFLSAQKNYIIPEPRKIEFIENQSKLRIIKNDINHLRNKPAKKYLEWRYKNY